MPRLLRVAGGEHPAGSMVDVKGWENDRINGQIPQASKTYTVVGLMNENQVSMGETTTGGRRDLVDRKGQLDYDALMSLTLQRARSAREAIKLVDQLANEYGYGSSGETFSIADKDEAWLMELIGKGPGRKGIVWVAARVPDGCITAHANLSRITTFPLDDPENWLYSHDVIRFAVEQGYYKTESGKETVQLPRRLPPQHRGLAEAGLRRVPGLEHLPAIEPFRELLRRLVSEACRGGRGLPALHQA